MRRVDLTFERPEPEVAAEAGKLHDESSVDLCLEESAEVFNPRGELLARYMKAILEPRVAWETYEALKDSARESRNRGLAAGMRDDGKAFGEHPVRRSGARSRTREAKPVMSGIVGFFDRYSRTPYCRLTAWTMEHQEEFVEALPAIQRCSQLFAEFVPERYRAQKDFVESTHKEWVIPGTVFTTITVNSNWQTAQHQDTGDCRQGFGVMAVLGHDFEGCWFLFPKYRLGFAMKPGDVILANVHEWHCNTPLRLLKPEGERLSLVMYYRENMEKCGTLAEELQIAKDRQEGDPTWYPEAPLFQ